MTEHSQHRKDSELPRDSLGKRRDTPYTYAPELLEAIPISEAARNAEQSSWVSLHCLRFTSLCPVTGQPDWAELTINYIPDQQLLESKALKEYLNSFRMHGDFHEDVCRIINNDLVQCCAPRYLEVLGHFDSRGSIAIWPYVQWAKPDDERMQDLLHERLIGYQPGAYRSVAGNII